MEKLTKKCGACKTDKLREAFNKYAQAKDGLQPRCRDCQRALRIDWYAENRDSEIAKAKAWRAANPDKVRAIEAARPKRDPEQRRAYAKAWYAENRTQVLAALSETRAADPDKYRSQHKAWRDANPDKIRAKHARELAKNPNLSKERYWKDPAYARQKSSKRKAMRLGASVGTITPKGLADRIAYYGGKCWMCGAPYAHLDHVKPLSKGGAHMLANLRPACAPCNLTKSDKWPFDLAA